MDIVDQALLRYDAQALAFRPVSSTLADGDQLLSSPRFVALADASYRSQDVQARASLSFARVPGDPQNRGMIICRVPDVRSRRLAAAAHVLIGRELNAGTALALSTAWPHWDCTGGAAQPLQPLGWSGLKNDAQQRNLDLQAAARAPELEAELTRLVDALLRVGTGRLAVIGYRSDPALLLAGAREILRDFVAEDWTFSTGEPAQKAGIRITFMLPGGSVMSDAYADLSAYDAGSSQLVSVAILVRAFMNSTDFRSWSAERAELEINDLDSLLAWASRGAPSAQAAVQLERNAHAEAARQWEQARGVWDSQRRGWEASALEAEAERQQLADELGRTRDQLVERERKLAASRTEVTHLREYLAEAEQTVVELRQELGVARTGQARREQQGASSIATGPQGGPAQAVQTAAAAAAAAAAAEAAATATAETDRQTAAARPGPWTPDASPGSPPPSTVVPPRTLGSVGPAERRMSFPHLDPVTVYIAVVVVCLLGLVLVALVSDVLW